MGIRRLTPVEVADADDAGWAWACPACGLEMIQEDPLAEGDILICDRCKQEFRCV